MIQVFAMMKCIIKVEMALENIICLEQALGLLVHHYIPTLNRALWHIGGALKGKSSGQ